MSLRVTADRTQWFVEAGMQEWAEWFDVETWQSITGEPASARPSSKDSDALWFEENWDSLAALNVPNLKHQLINIQADRAYGRLGLVRLPTHRQ
jgi:hypothetical protein